VKAPHGFEWRRRPAVGSKRHLVFASSHRVVAPNLTLCGQAFGAMVRGGLVKDECKLCRSTARKMVAK
jgi:hypothetical protein